MYLKIFVFLTIFILLLIFKKKEFVQAHIVKKIDIAKKHDKKLMDFSETKMVSVRICSHTA